MFGIGHLTNLVMGQAWSFARGYGEGLTRTAWRDGDKVIRNPARKLARRLRADAQQIFTGYRYNPKTMERIKTDDGFFRHHIGNRFSGILHLASNMTWGALGTGLGWATGVTGKALYAVSKPTAKLAGHTLYGGVEFIAGTTKDAAGLLLGNHTTFGKHALFTTAALGTTAIAAGGAISKDLVTGMAEPTPGMFFYQGRPIDSVPGTLASHGITSSNVMVDTGADGELVLALHNLR